MSAELENLKKWIGEKETAVDYITIPTVHRLSATLDRDDPFPKAGDALPIGWHSILFPRIVRHSGIGPDGHPARGDFLPPVPLPRRMFAGKRSTFSGDLRIGDELKRVSMIKDVTIKTGRTGQMVFVTVKTDISSVRGLAVSEEQDIVYRAEPDKNAPPPPPQPAPGTAVWKNIVTPTEVMLFRYSALTFNPHRIHYDRTYAMGTEGFPGLVVHGPFSQQCLLDLLRDNTTRPIRTFAMRARAPLFDIAPFTVMGRMVGDNEADLYAVGPSGGIAMQVRATLG